MRDIFISDLHIGIDAKTNLYQSAEHEDGLKAILSYIENANPRFDNIVILGDWLDLWMYGIGANPDEGRELVDARGTDGKLSAHEQEFRDGLLPTVKQIFDANPRLFDGKSEGSFVSCMEKITGSMYYFNGNHDMTVTSAEINDFLVKAGSKKTIKCVSDGDKYPRSDIHCEHGHRHTMVCGPNEAPLAEEIWPFGYYMTRIAASHEKKAPNPDAMHEVTAIMTKCGVPFSTAMVAHLNYKIDDVQSSPDLKEKLDKINITMPKGHEDVSSWRAADIFSKCKWDTETFLHLDCDEGFRTHARTVLNGDSQLKMVIFGHTHQPLIEGKTDSAYANTGFLCKDTSTPPPTFVEISRDQESPTRSPYRVQICGVDTTTTPASVKPYTEPIPVANETGPCAWGTIYFR